MVQRSEAYDPPEYHGWKPKPAALQDWQQTLDASRSRRRMIDSLSPADHLDLYLGLLRFRLMDTYLKRWVKQGVISKAWLGTGEEAVTVGNCFALRKGRDGDVVGPMIRNAGAYREMGMSMAAVFRSYLGTADQLCKGRDLHIGDLEYGVIAPISMVAALVPVCAGVALAFRQRHEDRVAMTWVGDGSARTGDFHEGLSLAAALGLPLVVVIQNNQVALGTRVEVHTRAALDKMHLAYGIKGYTCDGNNVLDTYAATRQAVTDCRKGRGPVLLTATTFRMGGHATHDEAEARELVPAALFEHWGERDPLGLYEVWLENSAFDLRAVAEERGWQLTAEQTSPANRLVLQAAFVEVEKEIETAAAEALDSRANAMPSGDDVTSGVYAQPCD